MSDSTELCITFVSANPHLAVISMIVPSALLTMVSVVEFSDLRQELIFRLKNKVRHAIKKICKESFMISKIFFTRPFTLNSSMQIFVFAVD